MRDLAEIRLINDVEKKIMNSSISALNPQLGDFTRQKSKNLYICLRKSYPPELYPSIFLVSDDLYVVLNKISDLNDLVAMGLYLGFIKKNYFYLSLEGVDYFYSNNLIPNNRLIVLNEGGEKSALYRNNISKGMIIRYPKDIRKDTILIAVNELNELLAIIITKVDSNSIPDLRSDDVIAQNLSDKGKYLREKQ
jgi:ribosome biogenesis protein Nip4